MQILEKQRKTASLESDSSTLSQTLELIQQEGVSLYAKLVEKRKYYATVAEATNGKLQEQQEWVKSYKSCSIAGQDVLARDKSGEKAGEAEVAGRFYSTTVMIEEIMGNAVKKLVNKWESAKSQLEMVYCTKSKLISQSSEVKQSIEQVRSRIADFKPELQAMNVQMLEEENQALLSDRVGETKYLHSLQQQIEKLEGISHVVKCSCGEEYKVEVNLVKLGVQYELYN